MIISPDGVNKGRGYLKMVHRSRSPNKFFGATVTGGWFTLSVKGHLVLAIRSESKSLEKYFTHLIPSIFSIKCGRAVHARRNREPNIWINHWQMHFSLAGVYCKRPGYRNYGDDVIDLSHFLYW